MHGTAEYLALPTECAPLAAMSALSWQRLRHLFLHGRYPIGVRDENGLEPTSVLRDLLRRTPGLRTLSIRNAQSLESFRAPILGPASVPPVHLAELRSLTVAYPDPEDSIFDINAPNLTYLSLRDEPRYYFTRRTHEPILRSSQCLRILRRMDSPLLESLEVVYEADGTDGDLLRHICTAYPRLARLELHRYRLDQYEDVAYITVAEHLGSIRTPQSARLNLDYPETAYGSTRDDPEQTANWLHVRDRRSKEVLTILEAACPKFECLGVLDPKEQCHAWVEYRPSWHP
ncbi:hypothetical protein BV20DRAFT_69502 [Pilatotrama ljubarskyi]|nr:hypothetical protein BV20DRAFT_69502 [Pilatotrama ljubarskyi]